jgi:hypothetical protein
MEKIKSLDLHNLNGGDFLQFNTNVLEITIQQPFLGTVNAQFKDTVNILESAYLKENLTLETAKITSLDEERDAAYTYFKLRVEAEAFNRQSPANMEAAKQLKSIIKQHGSGTLIHYDYNKETATLTSFVDAVNNQQPAALQQLGLTDQLNAIYNTNKAFSLFYSSRNQLAADLGNVPPFYKMRHVVRKSYKDFIKALESMPLFDASLTAQVETLIKRINIEVDKFDLLVTKPKKKETNGGGTGSN